MMQPDAPPMTLEQQVEYWMDRYFALQDERAAMVNQLVAIDRILHPGSDPTTPEADRGK